MKLTRAQFLKALPAAALVLAGCTAAPTAPADTDELVFDHAYPLDYATQFTADCYADGSTLLTIPDGRQSSLSAGGCCHPAHRARGRDCFAAAGAEHLSGVHLCYGLVPSSGRAGQHCPFRHPRRGLVSGRGKAGHAGRAIAYAGKYSAPDYERILTAECGLAVENTMIYHTPEVRSSWSGSAFRCWWERSSYESSPLARMEWIKLYGILLGKEALAEEVFAQQAQRIAPLLEQPSTGKRCAFSLLLPAACHCAQKRRLYVAQMIGMAGGEYVFADLSDSGNSLPP